MAKPSLGYWAIRGLAQPIRLMLEYTGTEFEDKKYECGPAPDYDKSCWFDVKPNFKAMGLHFPNLPYYIDGDIKISQSNAIMRYIGRKNDLCGKTEAEKAMVDVMADQVMDFRNGFVRLCYMDFDNKDQYLKDLDAKLEAFSQALGDNPWFAGQNLTFPDFHMYEMLDQHKQLAPESIAKYQNLVAFMERFEALPKIKEYMASPRFMKAPLNNKMARFGNE